MSFVAALCFAAFQEHPGHAQGADCFRDYGKGRHIGSVKLAGISAGVNA